MSMPTIFVSHGAPTLILGDAPARTFLAGLGRQIPRPTGIVAVSAHWDTDVPALDVLLGQAARADAQAAPWLAELMS